MLINKQAHDPKAPAARRLLSAKPGSAATRWGLMLGLATGLTLGAAALAAGGPAALATEARDSLKRFEQQRAAPPGEGTPGAATGGLQMTTEVGAAPAEPSALLQFVPSARSLSYVVLVIGLGVLGLGGLAYWAPQARSGPPHRGRSQGTTDSGVSPDALLKETQGFYGQDTARQLTTPLATNQSPAMPTLPRPLAAQAAYHNTSSAELLAMARSLADAQASPSHMLEALQSLGLPIQPMAPESAGVVSVTGNSIKGWNEDSALAFHSQHPQWGELQVLMAFDGMGGMRDGKLASKLAALCMALELHRSPDTLPADPRAHLVAVFERVNRRFKKASQELYGKVDADALRSTAIVVLAAVDHYIVGHQGDGGGYLLRKGGALEPLFEPHRGQANNLVTHSLGPVPDGEATVVARRMARQEGDLLYIASDGFDPVTPEQIVGFLGAYRSTMPLQTVVEGLTHEAMQARDERGLILDDNMSLAALFTPLASPSEAPRDMVQTSPIAPQEPSTTPA